MNCDAVMKFYSSFGQEQHRAGHLIGLGEAADGDVNKAPCDGASR